MFGEGVFEPGEEQEAAGGGSNMVDSLAVKEGHGSEPARAVTREASRRAGKWQEADSLGQGQGSESNTVAPGGVSAGGDNSSSASPAIGGGSGGFNAGWHGGRADTALIARAVKERWNIPGPAREEIPEVLRSIALNPERSARDRIAASKGLVESDKLNMEQERRADGGNDGLTVNVGVGVNLSLSLEERRGRLAELLGE